MLTVLMNKVVSLQEHMVIVNKKMKILRKKKKTEKNARDKNTVTEVKNAFKGLINRLDMALRKEALSLKISQ